MGRYLSEEQKKDLRTRVILAGVLTVCGAVVYVIGPGLQHVLAHAREHKEEPWAPERFWQVAQVMEWTWREDEAQAVYEEFYLHYCGVESIDEDLSGSLFADIQDNEDWWYYMPWVEHRYDPELKPRPRPVGMERHPRLGRVMASVAHYHERRRNYQVSNHIYSCLRTNWREGTYAHREGLEGYRRFMLRSF